MMSSRTKIAGPVIAAGAVSVGLVLIGACGVGRHDVYVPPPPFEAGPAAVAATMHDGTTVTAPKVVIPPSPTWQMAPAGPPRRPAGYSVLTTTTGPESEPTDSTTRPARTTTPRANDPAPEEPTTSTRTLSIEPTTVAAEQPAPSVTTEADAVVPPGPEIVQAENPGTPQVGEPEVKVELYPTPVADTGVTPIPPAEVIPAPSATASATSSAEVTTTAAPTVTVTPSASGE